MNVKLFQSIPPYIKTKLRTRPTPYIFFNLEKIDEAVAAVRKNLKPDHIFYSVKANSAAPVIRRLSTLQVGFEVNTLPELKTVAGFIQTPERIINSSPITPVSTIKTFVDYGISTYVSDSVEQLQRLSRFAPDAKILIRIKTLNTHSRFTMNNRFGLEPQMASDLIRQAEQSGLTIHGLHFSVGSQSTDLANWQGGIKTCAALFKKHKTLSILNIGGGFPVVYNEQVPSLAEIGQIIHSTIKRSFDKKPLLVVEPGRYLVAASAFVCTRVTQIIKEASLLRAILDASVFSGLFEILETNHRIEYPISTDSIDSPATYRLEGATCAGNDILVNKIALPTLVVNNDDPAKNSRIYFNHTGAYSMDYVGTSRLSCFNGVSRPKMIFWDGKKLHDEQYKG